MPFIRNHTEQSHSSVIIANNVTIGRSDSHNLNTTNKFSSDSYKDVSLQRLNSLHSQQSERPSISIETSKPLRKDYSTGILGSATKLSKRNTPSVMDTEGPYHENPIVLNVEMGRQVFMIKADLKWQIENVINQVFSENEDLFYNKESEEYCLEYNNNRLDNDTKLSSVPKLANNPRVKLMSVSSYTETVISGKYSKIANSLAEKDLVPTLTNKGYTTCPSYVDLCRMNSEELGNVKDFGIENEFGKIIWLEGVDLRGLNLDELVTIKKGMVEVYKDDEDSLYSKAKIGEGLNKPAMVTFFNITKKKNTTDTAFRSKIEEGCKQNGTKLIEWNPRQKEFTIQVSNF